MGNFFFFFSCKTISRVQTNIPAGGIQISLDMILSVVLLKGDRNLELKLAVLLTSLWYYLITLLAVEQYYTTEEQGQELDILYTHSLSSAAECLKSSEKCSLGSKTHKTTKRKRKCLPGVEAESLFKLRS